MTTIEIINKFLGLFKLTPRHLATFAITSFIVFILPAEIAKGIMPTTFYNYYRPIAGLIFLLSISGLLVHFFIFLYHKILIQLNLHKGKSYLKFLTEDEKNILRGHMSDETRTQYLSPLDGTVAELEARGILKSFVTQYNSFEGCPYGIADWALKYLKSNPHLLNPSLKKENKK